MKYFLTIAASDTSGGAGIQQDIKVAHDIGYWALSAITGITSQNFEVVTDMKAVQPQLLDSQIKMCLKSFNVTAIKIGAICSSENIEVIADCLKEHSCKNVVLDPVLSSSSGKAFLETSALEILKNKLFPLAKLITPNKPELEMLTGRKIKNINEAIDIAKRCCKRWGTSILIKGGHFRDKDLTEAIVTCEYVHRFNRTRKTFSFSHGTGCTFSTALACFLEKKKDLSVAYNKASNYLIEYYQSIQDKLK